VERVFPLYSPRIEKIEVVRRGAVRRAKLYYLRSRRGKSARIAEKVDRRFAAATVGKDAAPATASEAVEMEDEAMAQAVPAVEEAEASETADAPAEENSEDKKDS